MDSEVVFAVIGDVHGRFEPLRRVVDALELDPGADKIDGILIVGDFASDTYERRAALQGHDPEAWRGVLAETLAVVEPLGAPVAWVAGNHDVPVRDGPGCCDRRVIDVAGVRIFGIGGAGPARFGFPYEWDDEEIDRLEIPECSLLLCHAPPVACSLDRVRPSGRSAGSLAIRRIAERFDGVLVCGHIHEASGVEAIGDCLCLNAGALGPPFAATQVGIVRIGPGTDRSVEHRNFDSGGRLMLAS